MDHAAAAAPGAREGMRCLVAVLALLAAASSPAAEPLRSWTADFNDPDEVRRWEVHPFFVDEAAQVSWDIVPRSAWDSSAGMVLQVTAQETLGYSPRIGLLRRLPPEFADVPPENLVLEWEWRILNTETSDAVILGLEVEVTPEWERDKGTVQTATAFLSHTRFTMAWSVLWEPPNQWRTRRHTLRNPYQLIPSQGIKRVLGISIEFIHPSPVTVQFGSLRVEEWPHDSLAIDPVFLPHRAPAPSVPFEDTRLELLGETTAGALEDLDGDGMPDLLVLQRRGYSHLYLNDGHGGFAEEFTSRCGLELPTLGTGAMFVDLDGDGDPDLVETSEFEEPRLLENRGELRFVQREVFRDPLIRFWYGASAADLDGDGDPDLVFSTPYDEQLVVLINHGGWNFERKDVIDRKGASWRRTTPYFSAPGDLDGDGLDDIVAGCMIYRNDGARLVLEQDLCTDKIVAEREGAVLADLNADGSPELVLVRDRGRDPTGDQTVILGRLDDGRFAPLADAELPELMSNEVALVEDFNSDGSLDLYLCQNDRPNVLLLNDGTGRFEDMTYAAGLWDAGGCQAALSGDLDGDGAVDVVLLRHASVPRVLFNQLPQGAWIRVQVAGRSPGTDAVGARVRVLDPTTRRSLGTRWIRRGRGFGSVGPRELHLGIGTHRFADLEVSFPSGRLRSLRGVRAGSSVLVHEDGENGVFSKARLRFEEWRHPVARATRRTLKQHTASGWTVAGATALIGLIGVVFRKGRPFAVLLLLGGWLAALMIGPAVGRGLPGSPAKLWVTGAAVGIAAPLLVLGSRAMWYRVVGKAVRAAIPLEEVVRCTLDFRHGGLVTQDLLSIHGRVKNLFLSGDVHRPFLETLRARATHYRGHVISRLRQLLSVMLAAFPDMPEPDRLSAAVTDLEAGLDRLPPPDAGESEVQDWQKRVLPPLEEMRQSIPELLAKVDRRCSCDIGRALEETCETFAEACQAKGVRVEFVCPEISTRALITRADLLTVAENLFANALSALEDSAEKKIGIVLSQVDRKVCAEFEDTGPGIPPDLARRIFDYGFSTHREGRGYGLARSREILGHYGGSIELARKEEGRGARFVLALRAVDGGNG